MIFVAFFKISMNYYSHQNIIHRTILVFKTMVIKTIHKPQKSKPLKSLLIPNPILYLLIFKKNIYINLHTIYG